MDININLSNNYLLKQLNSTPSIESLFDTNDMPPSTPKDTFELADKPQEPIKKAKPKAAEEMSYFIKTISEETYQKLGKRVSMNEIEDTANAA